MRRGTRCVHDCRARPSPPSAGFASVGGVGGRVEIEGASSVDTAERRVLISGLGMTTRWEATSRVREGMLLAARAAAVARDPATATVDEALHHNPPVQLLTRIAQRGHRAQRVGSPRRAGATGAPPGGPPRFGPIPRTGDLRPEPLARQVAVPRRRRPFLPGGGRWTRCEARVLLPALRSRLPQLARRGAPQGDSRSRCTIGAACQ